MRQGKDKQKESFAVLLFTPCPGIPENEMILFLMFFLREKITKIDKLLRNLRKFPKIFRNFQKLMHIKVY